MNRLAEQAYLRTRLAIMHANLLGPEELERIARLPTEDLSTAIGLDLAGGGSGAKRLATFERALMQTWLDELGTLLRPLGGAARRLLTHGSSRYELLNIKALVRGMIGQLSREEIEQSLFQLPGFLSLNHDELLNTDNIPELLRRLQKTRYRGIATQALRRYEERPEPFLLDATLDQQFYTQLIDRARRLEAEDREQILNLIGRIVDRHNIVWSLRYRFNYGLQGSEVLYLAIDGGRKIDRRRLQEIVSADSLADALKALPDDIVESGELGEQITLVEARLRHDLDLHAQRALHRSPSVLTSVLAYLVLRHGEIKRLYAIAHAHIHGLDVSLLDQAFHPDAEAAA